MARRPRNDTRLALGMVAAVVVAAFAGWVLMPGGVPDWAPTSPLRDSSHATPKLKPPTTQIEAVEVASGTAPMVTLPVQTIPPGGVFFVDCATVRAAGATLRPGDAGYRPGLDRDGDGVACESRVPAATVPVRPVVVASQSTTPTTTGPRATTLPTSASAPSPPSALLLSVATTAPSPPPTKPAPVDVDGAPTIPPPPTTTAPVLPPVYGSCDDAAADGRVPLHPGQAGWNAALDVDGDGLACEDDSATLPTTPTPVPVVDTAAVEPTTTTTADNGR